jgi:AcrR family transcriptional regulator
MNLPEAPTRSYRMQARAEAAAATAERIVEAAVELFWEQPTDQIRLDEVAARAGVSVQTVIRRFGGREGLFEAAASREQARVRDARAAVTPGDVAGAVSNLVDHYESLGDRVLRMLAEEERVPALRDVVEQGRSLHREWCGVVFAPFLTGLTGVARDRRLAQLVVVCDVYTWKLLRRDCGLSRAQTTKAITEMLAPFTKEVR